MLVQKSQQHPSSVDSIRTYLKEIGHISLLTPTEEIEYGNQVQQMMSLLEVKKTLTQKMYREPTFGEWAAQVEISEIELNKTIRQGQQAKEKMIKANLRLVVAVAKNYQKRNLELPDLIQEGTIGLTRGVEKFDPTKGYRFSTYCFHWIRQAITRAIANQSRIIRLPIHVLEKLNKIKKVQRQLSQQLGRTATVSEIANQLELTTMQVRYYLKQTQHPLSLNMRVGEDQEIELGDLLEDSGKQPEDFNIQSCLSTDLESLLANLTSQQREVLVLRFGLANGEPLTLAKIGDLLNVTRERVRQVEKQALDQLRQHPKIMEKLIDYC